MLAVRRTTMVDDALHAEVERLKAENAALKARATRGVSIKVSEKGGVSVYGLGRFPVTLYKEQWAKLLDVADDIRAFIKEHDAQLKTKRSEEHTSELQSRGHLVCRLLLEKKKKN